MEKKVSFIDSLAVCLNSSEVSKLLRDKNIDSDVIKDQIKRKEGDLLKKVNTELNEIENYNKITLKTFDLYKASKKKNILHSIVIVLFWLEILCSSIGITSYFKNFPFSKELFSNFLSSTFFIYSIGGVFLTTTLFFFILMYRYQLRVNKIEEFSENNENGWNYRTKRVEEMISKTNKKLQESVILPEVILLINNLSKPNYNTTFESVSINTLNNDYSEKHEISTNQSTKLSYYLKNINSGTIGISGPRGIGKSTLLKSFYNSTERYVNEKKILPIFTNAPVKYEIRDFTIHLFTIVINAFLKENGSEEIDDSELYESDTFKKKKNFFTKRLLSLFFTIGIILITLNIGLIALESNNDKSKTTKSQDKTIVDKTVVDKYSEILDKYKYLTWGIISISISVFLYFILMDERKIRFSQEYKRNSIGEEPIVQLANRWKSKLKFQMGYTSGWSGNFKSPIGVELGSSSSLNYARNQLSFPEIVQGFKSFVERINDEYKVVIAIDELDKIDSSQDLNLFLNEIKALFDTEGCIFLMTISEEATLNFKNRDLGLKDVLDSSFDEVIRLEYFDFEQSRNLINKRILGLPLPIISFIYLYSGGIPREMLRTCRKILTNDAYSNKIKLNDTINLIVLEDIKAKLWSLLSEIDKQQFEFTADIFINLFNHSYIVDLGWNDLEILISNINNYNPSCQCIKTRNKLLKLKAYVMYMKAIGELFNNSYHFKTQIEINKAVEFNKYSELRQMINVNPIHVINKLKVTTTVV